MSKQTAIVILNWNGKKFLEEFLPSVIQNSKLDYVDIYVADNGSTDNSVDYLKTNFPTIKIVLLDKNYGFAGGYNKALEQITADYYILLNSDVEVTPNWIAPIIDFMETDTSITAVQPKIKSYVRKDYFEHAGAAGGYLDKFGYPFCRGRIIDKLEKDQKQYDDITEIFWATGACLFIRADDFSANQFDSNFFAHMEEIDLCWRLKNKGKKIFYYPEVTIYHLGGGTLPRTSKNKLFLNYRNNLLLLYKNLPTKNKFSIMFKRMILDGMSALVFLAKLKFSFFFAIVRAHIDFYKHLPRYKDYLSENQQTNKHKHKEIYKKSIIFDYFIRKKRTFTQINFSKN